MTDRRTDRRTVKIPAVFCPKGRLRPRGFCPGGGGVDVLPAVVYVAPACSQEEIHARLITHTIHGFSVNHQTHGGVISCSASRNALIDFDSCTASTADVLIARNALLTRSYYFVRSPDVIALSATRRCAMKIYTRKLPHHFAHVQLSIGRSSRLRKFCHVCHSF